MSRGVPVLVRGRLNRRRASGAAVCVVRPGNAMQFGQEEVCFRIGSIEEPAVFAGLQAGEALAPNRRRDYSRGPAGSKGQGAEGPVHLGKAMAVRLDASPAEGPKLLGKGVKGDEVFGG